MQFADGAKKHMEGTAKMNFTKLDGFCRGPCVRLLALSSVQYSTRRRRSLESRYLGALLRVACFMLIAVCVATQVHVWRGDTVR